MVITEQEDITVAMGEDKTFLFKALEFAKHMNRSEGVKFSDPDREIATEEQCNEVLKLLFLVTHINTLITCEINFWLMTTVCF